MNTTMASKPPEKSQNYREEAQIIRAKARELHDLDVRAQLLLIATLYDKLADHLLVAQHLRRRDNTEDPPE
jgi:hypothetical protein